jgi:hypothetical protein
LSCKTSRGYAAGSAKLATREFDICEFESHHPSPTINANGAIYIEGIAVRAVGGILIILVGLAWEFSAKLHTFVSLVNIHKWQAWLTATGDAPGGIVDEHHVHVAAEGCRLWRKRSSRRHRSSDI